MMATSNSKDQPPPPTTTTTTNPNSNNNNNNNNIPTLRTIEAALKLVDSKKQNLKIAFEALQSLPSSSSSSSSSTSFLPFSWSHLDSHFSSLHHSLSHRFQLLLQSYDSAPHDDPTHSELLSICTNMDGKRLREYVQENPKERSGLIAALRAANDPASLVLDAVEGFGGFLLNEKRSCVAILEALVEVKPRVREAVRERARRIGMEWKKGLVNVKKRVTPETFGFLNLVAAYGLGKEFDSGELLECFLSVCTNFGAPGLCKVVGLGDEANADLIQKLIDAEKEQYAVKFICVLGLADKFPPVPILRSWLEKVNERCDESYKEERCSGSTKKEDAISKAINSMTVALRIIDEFKLQYPKADLEKRLEMLQKRIEVLKKQKAEGLLGSPPDNKIQQQKEQLNDQNQQQKEQPKNRNEQQKELPGNQNEQQNKQPKKQNYQTQNVNKRPRTSTPAVPTPHPIGFVGSSLPKAGPLPAPTPCGLVNPTALYAGPPVGPYGFPGAPLGYPNDPNTSGAHLYSPQPYSPPPFGGYGFPDPYHSA